MMVEAEKAVFWSLDVFGGEDRERQAFFSFVILALMKAGDLARSIHERIDKRTSDTTKKKGKKKEKNDVRSVGQGSVRATLSTCPQFRHRRETIASKLHTRRGNDRRGGGKGRNKGIQKHTAHSDTMLLRKRKRGRAGGSAG